MKNKLLTTVVTAAMTAATAFGDGPSYTDGFFVVNEDWYGHQNSTVNYIDPDATDGNYWQYRVFSTVNPGSELGCTNQYGAIWDGKFYFIAKQDRDPGATVTGGRVTVADASTMKVLYQSPVIDPSGAMCDGRAFVGVDAHKGYISTSNGIWIFNLDTYTVTGQIPGTANPAATNLYRGQSGKMVLAGSRVFASHQSAGLLVIDTAGDIVTDTLSMDIVAPGAGIGSVVRAKDGNLWLSVSANVNGTGSTLPYLVKVDPVSLECQVVNIPDGFNAPTNSWYAWTPDAFVASTRKNELYWGGNSNSWFTTERIYRFDCDTGTVSLFADLGAEGLNWHLYGCSLGVHPLTDEVYMSLYHDFSDTTYLLRRYGNDGTVLREYNMISNYWFPSMMVFPQNPANESGVSDIALSVPALTISVNGRILHVKGMESPVQVYVMNMAGTVVKTIPATDYETEINLESLASGLYIVRAGSSTAKIAVR